MASYEEHISQSIHNLNFLLKINTSTNSDFWDWHVTVCYYSAVHLVNAHLAKAIDQHYRKHEDVAVALNPNNQLSVCKVSEEVYLAYVKLQNLSRRSRYLISENNSNREISSHLTYDKHFKRALTHLDKILSFISNTYKEKIEKFEIHCLEGKSSDFIYFNILND